jgi:hypothetical protein
MHSVSPVRIRFDDELKRPMTAKSVRVDNKLRTKSAKSKKKQQSNATITNASSSSSSSRPRSAPKMTTTVAKNNKLQTPGLQTRSIPRCSVCVESKSLNDARLQEPASVSSDDSSNSSPSPSSSSGCYSGPDVRPRARSLSPIVDPNGGSKMQQQQQQQQQQQKHRLDSTYTRCKSLESLGESSKRYGIDVSHQQRVVCNKLTEIEQCLSEIAHRLTLLKTLVQQQHQQQKQHCVDDDSSSQTAANRIGLERDSLLKYIQLYERCAGELKGLLMNNQNELLTDAPFSLLSKQIDSLEAEKNVRMPPPPLS